MSKKVKYALFFLALAAFVAFSVLMEVAGLGPSRVKVEIKQSSGYGFVDAEALKKYVLEKVDGLSGDSLSKRIFSQEKKISQNPYIEKVVVYAQPSGDIRVELWEEIPVFRLVTDTGNYYVSRRDKMMPVKAGTGVDVPVVSGQADKKSFPDIRWLISALKEDKFFSSQTVGIEVSRRKKKDGNVYDYAVYTRSPGFKVVLGTTEDLDVKLDNFRVIYSYLYDQNRTGDYKVVNLEFVNYLICQKK